MKLLTYITLPHLRWRSLSRWGLLVCEDSIESNRFAKLFSFTACLVLILLFVRSIDAAWYIETVASGSFMGYTSLAIDSSDHVHISYYEHISFYEGGNIRYATNVSGVWEIESVACSVLWTEGGPKTSIALDSNNKVHIGHIGCIGGMDNPSSNYTTNVSGSWVTEPAEVGRDCISVAIDSNDKVHMIGGFIDDNTITIDYFEYATNASGTWIVESLDYLSFNSALALDSNDKVHISYAPFPPSPDTTIIHLTNASGSWVIDWEEILSGSGFIVYSSLAIDSNNKVHICYDNNGLNYATNALGYWITEHVDSVGGSEGISLALDSNDKAHIGYYDDWNGEIKYATNTSGSWETETLENASYLSPNSHWASNITLALDSLDKVHISYPIEGGEIRYARRPCLEMDSDCDDILDDADNCLDVYNPNQEDTYPPEGNSIGDACECEGDFDCDGDVDGSDATTFKLYFGRNLLFYPCDEINPCRGDFDCDQDCDGTDAVLFKEDFGRSSFNNPCFVCVVGDWCVYP